MTSCLHKSRRRWLHFARTQARTLARTQARIPDTRTGQTALQDLTGPLLDRLTTAQLRRLRYDWSFWAREKQLPPPGDWRVWLLLAGRGFGKLKGVSR